MVSSMTGYGEAKAVHNNKKVLVEIRALNGKVSDVRLKLPTQYRDKELLIRNQIIAASHRGKLDVSINIESESGDESYALNASLFKRYYDEITKLEKELGYRSAELTSTIMRLPNVVMNVEEEVDENEWKILQMTIDQALAELEKFRLQEGRALKADMKERIRMILVHLEAVNPHEEDRITRLRNKIQKIVDDNGNGDQIDNVRFEQEILYYLERLDINEEKVRLAQHCQYFTETIENDELVIGRKLNFIAQEIGREINTLGAKAQHSDIQRYVVQMKDELEKLKEQIANTL